MSLILILISLMCVNCGFSAFLPEYFEDVNYLQDVEPPAPDDIAQMARYIVHSSDWTSIGTISVSKNIEGFPFVGLKSISDGPVSNGSGVPYMMMTDRDISMNDLNHDNRCTLFMSLAEGKFCADKTYDPQDPRCARIMLTGSVVKLENESPEEAFAKDALYSRHPAMKYWPTDHGFYIVKLDIKQIGMLDYFGGIKHVKPEDYFNANNFNAFYELDNLIKVIQVGNK